jgi:hypothetical protein
VLPGRLIEISAADIHWHGSEIKVVSKIGRSGFEY